MDGLIVKSPFADLIIDGNKRWELRSKPVPKSKIGNTILLLSQGNMLGKIKIKKNLGPFDVDELKKTVHLHNSNLDGLDDSFSTYVWEVEVTEKFVRPKRYFHPQGAQVWVKNVISLQQYMKGKINYYL